MKKDPRHLSKKICQLVITACGVQTNAIFLNVNCVIVTSEGSNGTNIMRPNQFVLVRPYCADLKQLN